MRALPPLVSLMNLFEIGETGELVVVLIVKHLPRLVEGRVVKRTSFVQVGLFLVLATRQIRAERYQRILEN